ncbi:MAG: hypothetical protein J5857_01100 [Treponema sp.]|nr:hypothetical protein [Treponema sp.]
MKKILMAALAALMILSVLGCSKKKEKKTNTVSSGSSQSASNNSDGEEVINWTNEDGVICVLFGYGFNSDESYTDVLNHLSSVYGLDENGGLLYPVRFPDDLKNKIGNLYSYLSDVNIRGLILLGAPEGTHLQLLKFQNEDGERDIPIFSFFPQDDALGQECTCDFVLEYERNAQEQADSTEVENKIDKDAEDIALRAVKYMALLNGPLPMNDKLREHIQNIAGEAVIKRYVDHDTGIQSMNHYVLEKK